VKCSACGYSEDSGTDKFIRIDAIPSEWATFQTMWACPVCGILQLDIKRHNKVLEDEKARNVRH
jgi:rubredoxin